MNKKLQAEFIKLETEITELAEADLKAADELARKEVELKAVESKQKVVAAPGSQNTDQTISTPAPLPPEQDPNKNKKQKQENEQEKKKPPLGENEFPDQKAQQEHNWRKGEGHVERTPKNEKLMYDVANDPNCYLGPDKRGHHWYGKILKDGKQAWVEVRDNIMQGWGINEPGNIKTYNPKTGLKALRAPSQKILKLSGKS